MTATQNNNTKTINNKTLYAQYIYKSIEKHREKQNVRDELNSAVKTGKVTKPTHCEDCKTEPKRLEGHHEDYSKPLEVIWLCTPCHAKADKVLRARGIL